MQLLLLNERCSIYKEIYSYLFILSFKPSMVKEQSFSVVEAPSLSQKPHRMQLCEPERIELFSGESVGVFPCFCDEKPAKFLRKERG